MVVERGPPPSLPQFLELSSSMGSFHSCRTAGMAPVESAWHWQCTIRSESGAGSAILYHLWGLGSAILYLRGSRSTILYHLWGAGSVTTYHLWGSVAAIPYFLEDLNQQYSLSLRIRITDTWFSLWIGISNIYYLRLRITNAWSIFSWDRINNIYFLWGSGPPIFDYFLGSGSAIYFLRGWGLPYLSFSWGQD